MTLIEPLELQTWLLNVLAGSSEIFVFLAVIIVAALCARFRMPNVIFGVMLALFAVMFANFFPGIYVIALIIIGYITFGSLANVFR